KYLLPEDAVVAKQVNNRAFGVLARSVPGDQRGQPKNNDAFFSTLLRFGWRIAKEPATPSYMRCPRF
ncbi:MAG TPA: hypothetical protein VFL47_12400, partial [Flavisolibacter sp.]|nr:hypothetical protein [Flavisolibacter sp.]